MKQALFFIVNFFFAATAGAQVLNIESKRFFNDTADGWLGQASLSFAAEQNVNRVYALGNMVHVQFRQRYSRVIFLNNFSLNQVNGENFINTGYQHLRYNYKYEDSRLTWEAFLQSQYNKPMKMDFRGLIGAGPRFSLVRKEKLHAHLATLYMFEHEIDDGGKYVYNDHRLDAYFTVSWSPGKTIELINTIYYQPNFADFHDRRILEEFTAAFDITKRFSIHTVFNLLEDTKQPPGVPETTWAFSQRIAFSF